ncbi:MAG: transposase [Cyclobacteriaceae bacterium]
MSLQQDKLYHFYNQGNNRERIFFSTENYLYFLGKFRKYVWPHCQVLAYCLMPNHFHFLINTTKASVVEAKVGSLDIPALNNGFRQLLSSYAQAINKQEGRSGSLFRQKTKAKLLEESDEHYPFICFNYIHQNPLRAGLVSKLEDWEFSSFADHVGIRNGSLCDQEPAKSLLGISKESIYEESYQVIPSDLVKQLF